MNQLENPIIECICCLEELTEEQQDQSYSTRDGDTLCEQCYNADIEEPESEIIIHYSKGKELYTDYDLIQIGSYVNFSSDSEYQDDFNTVSYYSNWRGYSDLQSDNWKEIGFVNVRAFDESQKHLENIIDEYEDLLLENNIIYATAQSRTSNVMVVNFTLWIQNENYNKALELKNDILNKYNLSEGEF